MTTKISEANIQATTLGALGGGGPKISSIIVTDSSYNNLDDTAVALGGGYIKLIGEDFATGCQVLIGLTPVTSVTFVSDTEVRAQVPATAAGTYIVYLVNSDGGTAIRVNAITFSSTPTWVTDSSLIGLVNSSISIQLSASLAATYSLQAGSSLPAGVSLSSSGLISGTVTGISSETVYNFTVLATDTELQDSPRSFALTISLGDPYFMYNTLLLPSNGTNNSQNNTFLDSSTNNFTITRNGNTTQGTFSPYGSNWSNYFDGTGDYLTGPSSNTAFHLTTNGGTGFTVEAWICPTGGSGTYRIISSYYSYNDGGAEQGWMLRLNTSNQVEFGNRFASAAVVGGTAPLNTWIHVAGVINGTTIYLYVNGVSVGTPTALGSQDYNGAVFAVAAAKSNNVYTSYNFFGYISNLRVVTSTLYTSTFTPSTTPLTAISGTSLLTCADNRFIDDSTNNFAITCNGNVSVQRFSPFGPSAAYNKSTFGGSAYFDGSGDYLLNTGTTAGQLGSGNFTFECWYYPTNSTFGTGGANTAGGIFFDSRATAGDANGLSFYTMTNGTISIYTNGSVIFTTSNAAKAFAWNHIAFVRSGSTITGYINGVSGGTVTSSVNFSSGRLQISGPIDYAAGYIEIVGYVSDHRVVKGTAVYTATFTPPTEPLTAVANTSLLLNYTNAGVIDNTMMHHVDTIANSKISTTQSKFGGASVYIDGADDYLQIPASNLLDLGTSDFTIECWVYNETISTNYPSFIASITGWSAGASGHRFDNTGYANKFWFGLNGSGGIASGDPFMASTNTFNHNQWYHYAVTRSGNTWRMFVDGVLENTQTYSGSYNAALGGMRLGYSTWDGVQGWWKGYIDDLRVTKGYARYTSNFTPPSSALLTQ